MPAEDLAELIEERDRVSPPAFPCPVGPRGYHITLQGPSHRSQGGVAGFHAFVGARKPLTDNTVTLDIWKESAVWRDQAQGVAILEALIDAWEPESAIAFAFLRWGEPMRERPWLAWTAKPLHPRPVPPFGREYPYPWPLDDAGPPAESPQLRDGELQIWP